MGNYLSNWYKGHAFLANLSRVLQSLDQLNNVYFASTMQALVLMFSIPLFVVNGVISHLMPPYCHIPLLLFDSHQFHSAC